MNYRIIQSRADISFRNNEIVEVPWIDTKVCLSSTFRRYKETGGAVDRVYISGRPCTVSLLLNSRRSFGSGFRRNDPRRSMRKMALNLSGEISDFSIRKVVEN